MPIGEGGRIEPNSDEPTDDSREIQTNPEQRPAEEIKGRSLESAFYSEENSIIDDQTRQQIDLQGFTQYLLRDTTRMDQKTDMMAFSDSSVNWDQVNKVQGKIENAPRDHETVRLRQELLTNLVSDGNGKKKIIIENFDNFRKVLDDANELLDIPFKETDDLKGVQQNITVINFFKEGRSTEKIDQLHKLVGEIPEHSQFMQEFKAAVDSLKSANAELVGWVKQSDMDVQLGMMADMMKSSPDKLPADFKFESKDDYRDAVNEMNEKFNDIREYSATLSQFDMFLDFSEVIVNHDLNKVELTDENIIEFKGARNPILVRSKGKDNVVPADISITPEHPNVVVTGDNATGKSKLVETVLFNSLMAQTIGYSFSEGGKYSPRGSITHLQSSKSEVTDTQYSRGQNEMKAIAGAVDGMGEKDLIILDEFLTSTDSVGAMSIVIAILEKNSAKGGMSMLTIHSRDLERIKENNIAPSLQFLKAKEGEPGENTYQWEEGIGRADPIRLAEDAGLPDDVLARASEIQRELEKGYGEVA